MTLKKHHILFLLCFCFCLGFSQKKASSKKCKKLLKEAQYYFDGEEYANSFKTYRQVLVIDPANETAGVNACICSFKLNYTVDSVLFLIPNLKTSGIEDATYYHAKIKHQLRNFNEAITLLEKYSQVVPSKRLHSTEEINYLMAQCISARAHTDKPHRSTIKNMGPNINSPFADYVPVIIPDESALYFTSKREGSSNNKKNGDNTFMEDVYVSFKQNGNWTKAENVGPPINTESNDACVAISPDGQRMIVYRTDTKNIESGDLYLTRLGANNKWLQLDILNKAINSPYIETSACFSKDSSEIYFSSNRPGGLGGKDIYRIKKLPNGQWSPSLNLGSTVNTKYDDDAPFMHPDGITLYFSSKGHDSMGDYDVFKSVWNPDIHEFSQAENLGYPINDVGSDIFFVLSEDGQRGYYSSIKNESFGGVDIYQIDTRFGDNDLSAEEGYVFADGAPVRARVSLTDTEDNNLLGDFYSNPETGKFILILNPLKTYKAVIEADDCESQEMEIKPLQADLSSHYLQIKLKKNSAH